MDLIPHDELKPSSHFNFAPMIDFLFLMLSLFATLALSRVALYDTNIQLTSLKPQPSDKPVENSKNIQQINISIDAAGSYKWMTEFQEHPMESVASIQEELVRQYQIGALAKDKSQTEILLHIDKKASWEPIAQVIFGVRELGFNAYPIYEPLEENSKK